MADDDTTDTATATADPPAQTADPPSDAEGATGEESQAPKYDMSGQSEIDKESGVADDREYTKQLQNQYQTDLKRSEDHAHTQKQSEDYFNSKIKELSDMKPPSVLGGQQQQMPPMAPQAKQHITATIFQVLAIAATAAQVFGTRRNPGTQGAIMNGLGVMFQNIAKGRMEQAKEAQVQWHQLNEDVQKENRERLQDYKDVLANKKLTLDQQMELFRMKGQFYRDSRLEKEASDKDLQAIHKNLLDKQKQLKFHATNTPKTTEEHKRWRDMVMEKSSKAGAGKMDVDTDAGYDWALHNYPLSQFKSEEKTSTTTTTTDDSGKKTTEKTGGFNLGSGTTPDSSKSDYDKHMDTLFGSAPKQKKDSVPAKTPDQPAKSVLSPEGDDGSGIW